jgi:hypothetical protein
MIDALYSAADQKGQEAPTLAIIVCVECYATVYVLCACTCTHIHFHYTEILTYCYEWMVRSIGIANNCILLEMLELTKQPKLVRDQKEVSG